MPKSFGRSPARLLSANKPHSRYRFDIYTGSEIEGTNSVCDHFLRYWRQLKPPTGLPRREDIKLTDLRGYARHTVFLDIAQGAQFDHAFSLCTRLIGTAVADEFGEITGRVIAEMANQEAARRIYSMAARVIADRAPAMSFVAGLSAAARHKDAFALYMPLGDEAGAVAKILVAVDVGYLIDENAGES